MKPRNLAMKKLNSSYNIKSIVLSNPVSAKNWMKLINGPHEIKLETPSNLLFKGEVIQIGNSAIGTNTYSTEAEILIDDISDSFVIGLPLEGNQRVETREGSFLSSQDTATLISPGKEMMMKQDESCRKQMISFSRAEVERKLSETLGKRLHEPLVFDSRMDLHGEAKSWWDFAIMAKEAAIKNGNFLTSKKIWLDLESSLIKSLITTQPSNYHDLIKERITDRPAFVEDIENYIKKKFSHPIRLEDLEKFSGLSRARFYAEFKRYFGTTPIAYLKEIRLNEARRLLENHMKQGSIADIAMECGFTQLGRFSSDYRERFGELPSMTRKIHGP